MELVENFSRIQEDKAPCTTVLSTPRCKIFQTEIYFSVTKISFYQNKIYETETTEAIHVKKVEFVIYENKTKIDKVSQHPSKMTNESKF